MIRELYHYTTGQCFAGIVADGAIKPATAFIADSERPAVWLTLCGEWDKTANKAYREDDGSIRPLSLEETAEMGGGLVRIVLDAQQFQFRLTWPDYVKKSGIDKRIATTLADVAIEKGSKLEDWRVCFQPIPRLYWLRVDVWQGGQWVVVPMQEEVAA